ncbi:MAG: hypothetical protein HC915_18480 [Anaerolineae bacterium]|nr:hypothetical protein [Anaerolineae bacterium]
MLIPGAHGLKMPKWINRLEWIGYPFRGYWESRGWPDEAVQEPRAYILAPQEHATLPGLLRVEGVALTGLAPLEGVEVRLDGGPWLAAALKRHAHPLAWTPWALDGLQAAPGWVDAGGAAPMEATVCIRCAVRCWDDLAPGLFALGRAKQRGFTLAWGEPGAPCADACWSRFRWPMEACCSQTACSPSWRWAKTGRERSLPRPLREALQLAAQLTTRRARPDQRAGLRHQQLRTGSRDHNRGHDDDATGRLPQPRVP